MLYPALGHPGAMERVLSLLLNSERNVLAGFDSVDWFTTSCSWSPHSLQLLCREAGLSMPVLSMVYSQGFPKSTPDTCGTKQDWWKGKLELCRSERVQNWRCRNGFLNGMFVVQLNKQKHLGESVCRVLLLSVYCPTALRQCIVILLSDIEVNYSSQTVKWHTSKTQ